MKTKIILLVDDDQDITDLYKERLEMDGYQIESAFNGSEAIEKLAVKKPDLVLLDVMMPKLGGVDVLEFIRSQAELQNIPVFVFTALSNEKTKLSILARGADEYLVKTKITPKDLAEKIKRIFQK